MYLQPGDSVNGKKIKQLLALFPIGVSVLTANFSEAQLVLFEDDTKEAFLQTNEGEIRTISVEDLESYIAELKTVTSIAEFALSNY